jgi:heat shock protein HslJ
MKAIKILIVAALAVLLSGCCACRRGGSVAPLVDTPWKLSQLGGITLTETRPEAYTMTLGADGRVSGTGGCNRFSGTFARTETGRASGTLAMGGDMISTRMMCLDGTREAEFLSMLAEVDSYSIDGARLLLIRGGDVLAIFDRVDTPTLIPAE